MSLLPGRSYAAWVEGETNPPTRSLFGDEGRGVRIGHAATSFFAARLATAARRLAFAHRALTAFRADALRSAFVIDAARALPPIAASSM